MTEYTMSMTPEFAQTLAKTLADRPPVVEIIHGRDPDSECGFSVYVDGVKVQAYVEDIDPGRGWLRSDWDERIEAVRNNDRLSPAFRDEAVASLEEFGSSPYIEDPR